MTAATEVEDLVSSEYEHGFVTGMECLRDELGTPDESGRRRPVPKPDAEVLIDADLVIVSIGSGANPILTGQTGGLELNRRGYIVTGDSGATSRPGVWAGGDIVTGSATVILAMGAGKAAAAMARAVETHWPGELSGLVVTRYGHGVPCERIEVVEAAHPVPDEAGRKAAARMLAAVRGLTADDLVLVLISGGGTMRMLSFNSIPHLMQPDRRKAITFA